MLKKSFISFLLITAVFAVSACGGGGGASSSVIPGPGEDMTAKYAASDQKAAAVDKSLTAACNSSAIALFKELSKTSAAGDNIFISPLSVTMALSMVTNGAAGDTLSGMKTALSLGGMDAGTMNAAYKNLIESLENADAGVVLTIANSLWIRDTFSPAVKRAFIDTLSTYFACAPRTLDFASPQAVATINSWVESKTNGLIKSVIDKIDDGIVLFIINAIYFKGGWITEFPAAATKADTFNSPSGAVPAQFMNASAKFKYYDGADFSAVRLPYGRDKIAMYIFLPKQAAGYDAFLNSFPSSGHDAAMAAMASSQAVTVNLKMPKFKFEYGVKRLNDALKALGMQAAFDPSAADLSNIASNLYIAFVDHKAVIDVNEKGSEAAAVTVIGIGVTSVPVDIVNFTVDRPFLFTIRDDRTGCVLFMGKVAEPKY